MSNSEITPSKRMTATDPVSIVARESPITSVQSSKSSTSGKATSTSHVVGLRVQPEKQSKADSVITAANGSEKLLSSRKFMDANRFIFISSRGSALLRPLINHLPRPAPRPLPRIKCQPNGPRQTSAY